MHTAFHVDPAAPPVLDVGFGEAMAALAAGRYAGRRAWPKRWLYLNGEVGDADAIVSREGISCLVDDAWSPVVGDISAHDWFHAPLLGKDVMEKWIEGLCPVTQTIAEDLRNAAFGLFHRSRNLVELCTLLGEDTTNKRLQHVREAAEDLRIVSIEFAVRVRHARDGIPTPPVWP